jgi:hypothetical protein
MVKRVRRTVEEMLDDNQQVSPKCQLTLEDDADGADGADDLGRISPE